MDNLQVLRMGNAPAVMRLMVEGAVSTFEDEAPPLFRLALNQKMNREASAFNMLGIALYELRTHIHELQTECEETDAVTS